MGENARFLNRVCCRGVPRVLVAVLILGPATTWAQRKSQPKIIESATLIQMRSTSAAAVDTTSPLTVSEMSTACDSADATRNPTTAAEQVRSYCHVALGSLTTYNIPGLRTVRTVLLRATEPGDVRDINTGEKYKFFAGGAIGQAFTTPGFVSFQSMFLGAATDLLVSRAEDALKTDVVLGFSHRVCKKPTPIDTSHASPKIPIVQLVSVGSAFATTCKTIENLGTSDSKTPYTPEIPSLSTLRAAVRKDLRALPDTVERVLGFHRARLADTVDVANDPKLDSLYAYDVLALTIVHLARGIAAGQELSVSLASTSDSLGRSWAGRAHIPHLKQVRGVLPFAASVGIASTISGAWPPRDSLRGLSPSDISARVDLVTRTSLVSLADSGADGWPRLVREWKGPKSPADSPAPIIHLVSTISNPLVQALAELPTSAEFRRADGPARVAMVSSEAEILILALLAAHDSADGGLDSSIVHLAVDISHLSGHVSHEDYAQIVLDIGTLSQLWGARAGRPYLSQGTIRLLQFAGDVALAEDGEAMQSAFARAIAPPDRYLAKRGPEPTHRLWLNAYVGGSVGAERLAGSTNKDIRTAAGLALPVGLEWQTPSRAVVFAQLLDLGQVVNYRIGDTANVKRDPPGLTVQTVFSPGLFLVLRPGRAVKAHPFALLLGASYSPLLRQEKNSAGTFSPADAIRLSANFGVDIPILP